MMSSALLLNLLLLVSIASAGHHYGGSVTFSPKGANADGSMRVEFRIKRTYDWCDYGWWYCASGNCGNEYTNGQGQIDSSSNGRSAYTNSWCQTETVVTRNIYGNTPFDLHVPQNCPRTYHLMAYDPDGDQVRCRYGNQQQVECATCNQPSGFNINQDACTLDYSYTYNRGVYGFELILEDFPRKHTTLAYTDGSSSYRCSLNGRYRRSIGSTAYPWYYQQTTVFYYYSFIVVVVATATIVHHSTYNYAMVVVATATIVHHSTYNYAMVVVATATIVHHSTYNYAMVVAATIFYYYRFIMVVATATIDHRSTYNYAMVVVAPATIDHNSTNNIPVVVVAADHNHNHNNKLTTTVHDYHRVSDVIISGPLNITKHALSTGEYAIRWTPTRNELGDHFPVCFVAESMSGSSIYQSEMRCVIVNVGHQTVDANVICTGTNIVIEIEQLHSVGLHKDYLRLNDPACTLDSNGTHVLANFSLNACGTMIEEDDQYIIFKNEIFSTDDPNSIITRKHEVEIEFSCRFEKKNNISLEFTARRHTTTITERGFGTLTYSFGLFRTANYYQEIDVIAYPAEYELGEMIYMQIESQSSINNTELFVESCVATPFNDPNYQTSYTIIQDGCILDETVEFYTSHQPMVRFGLQAFQFIGMHEQVFISCSVILCEANNPNTRCSQGCVNSTVAPPSHHHRKREAPIQTGSHLVSQGPLRLKRSVEGEVSSSVLNLNLVFIAGCLLAAIGMVCGVLIYKTRRPEVKYQPLQTNDI
ncbi:uncharacterized protein [Chanodichthys erythropterus]|uniref:uncharacterized protein n=1 Tax=Chanodichthys erythropterus TaxID=933992 RepID=UPI00351EA5AF